VGGAGEARRHSSGLEETYSPRLGPTLGCQRREGEFSDLRDDQ
jgi:hypothetical protein